MRIGPLGPLGCLGEIGGNMTVFKIDGKLLVVDCGVLFPEENQPGVNLFLVDSTNANVPGFTPNERDIGPVIESVMAKATRRVIVASSAPSWAAGSTRRTVAVR